jgi:hypothetical protein
MARRGHRLTWWPYLDEDARSCHSGGALRRDLHVRIMLLPGPRPLAMLRSYVASVAWRRARLRETSPISSSVETTQNGGVWPGCGCRAFPYSDVNGFLPNRALFTRAAGRLAGAGEGRFFHRFEPWLWRVRRDAGELGRRSLPACAVLLRSALLRLPLTPPCSPPRRRQITARSPIALAPTCVRRAKSRHNLAA